jgi:hypothetical protein
MATQKKQSDINREKYMLASRNTWLIWRLRAIEAGYVPPLLPGKIPPELLDIFTKDEDYHVEPLIEHAEKMKVYQRNWLSKKVWLSVFIAVMFILGLTASYQLRDKPQFRIGLIEALTPKVEMTQDRTIRR